MPPLPVISNVFRITIPWSQIGGVSPRNIFHVLSPDSNDVDEIVASLLGGFGDADSTKMFKPMNSTVTATSLDVIPLDGTTAQQSVALGGTIGGGSTGEMSPATAAVVSFHTARRGARGRGRMYVGPCVEGVINNGVLDSTVASTMVTAWGDFITSLPTQTPQLSLVVASYAHADQHAVVSHRVDFLVGTQRRRQDQLR